MPSSTSKAAAPAAKSFSLVVSMEGRMNVVAESEEQAAEIIRAMLGGGRWLKAVAQVAGGVSLACRVV